MFIKKILWLYATITVLPIQVQGFQMNMTQYYRMPSLYNIDDYDRCLQEFNSFALYCFVRADVIAQPNSEAWQAIEEISQYYKHHFNHSHLYYGICVKQCESQIESLSPNQTNALFTGILTNNTKVNTYLNLFKTEEFNRKRYNRLMNQCVNLRLQKYGLSAKSEIEYCDHSNRTIAHDPWNIMFYCVLCILILLVVSSSLFDLHLKYKRDDKLLKDRDYYKTPPEHTGNKICVSFSMARNWYRLIQEPSGRMGRELRFLDCFKVFAMFLVVFAHTNWVLYESAISNPQDHEKLLHSLAGTVLIAGALITVTFFVIAGFLLTLNWLTVAKDNKKLSTWEYVVFFTKCNTLRYMRLTIPYAFVILWSGVYFDGAGGPLWRHIFEREQLSCRKNWWTNLLYLNNYINTNERCMLQGWYLASDTQSFLLSLFILMLAHRWSKVRNWIYGVTVVVFVAVPGVVTYRNKFQALIIPSPQIQRDSFIGDRQFNESYAPFHMNFGCYFIGVLAALVYDHVSTKQIRINQNRLFNILFYSIIPICILWMFSGHFFIQEYNEEGILLWTSVFASLYRNVWALGVAILIIGMSAKCGWVLRKFCCLPIFRILGRLTYGAFAVNLLISRSVIATLREPLYFGTGIMFAFVVFTMSASYAVSLFLSILLELPVSSFLKLLR